MRISSLNKAVAGLIAAATLSMSAIAPAQAGSLTAPTVPEIMAKTPEAFGIFAVTSTGDARHIQSGLICPISLPNLNLWHLQIFDAKGTDVGCDYGRQGANNRWIAKLTLYAVKAAPGDTVDAAFARYRNEVLSSWPDAKIKGAAIEFEGAPPPGMENVRSEEYELDVKGVRTTSDLVVAMKDGWVIEIRMSTATTVSNPDEAAKAVTDMGTPVLALMKALETIGNHPDI